MCLIKTTNRTLDVEQLDLFAYVYSYSFKLFYVIQSFIFVCHSVRDQATKFD